MTAQAWPIERPPARLKGWRERSVLPGFPLALGVTLAWLGAIVILPLTALALRPWELGPVGVWAVLTEHVLQDTRPRSARVLRLGHLT